MALLLQSLQPHYDFILMDTPALDAAADAAILGRLAAAIVLVVRPGVVDTKGGRSGEGTLGTVGSECVGAGD